MALYHAPALILVPALLINVAIAARAGWARRTTHAHPIAESTPETPAVVAPRGAGALAPSLVVALMTLVASWLLFPAWDRFWPVGLGVALGALIAIVWQTLLPDGLGDDADLGPLGTGLAFVAALALLIPDPTSLANALVGLLAGWAALALYARLATDAVMPAPFGLVTVAAVGAAAAWGEKLHIGANLGAPLAVGVGTVLAVGLTVASLMSKPEGDTRAPGLPGLSVAFVITAGLGSALAAWVYGQPLGLVGALVLGALAGVLLPLTQSAGGGTTPLRALVALAIGGAILIVDNRLMGVVAIALGGVGLGLGAIGRPSARGVMALLVGIFAARAWLQLFLDRTLLTGYGVDLTHPYAFAALILGGLMPFAALAVGQLARPNRYLVAVMAAVAVLAPAWIGYFIHVEALGALMAGLVLAAFALGAQADQNGVSRVGGTAGVAATLLIAQVATSLLAAPWLVGVMNATRQERLVGLLLGLVLVAAWVGAWWFAIGRRQTAQAA